MKWMEETIATSVSMLTSVGGDSKSDRSDISSPNHCVSPTEAGCASCGQPITDRFLAQVNGKQWHMTCLRCCICTSPLERHTSCFVRSGRVYCRQDYERTYEAKCARCCRKLSSSDWVRRAKERVYHLACFACDACRRQLSTGEEFALHEDKVLCKVHYLDGLDTGSASSDDGDELGANSKSKRVRTTFTEEQLAVLQANFVLDSNPDGQDLERIANLTGLSKRVTQVWFQNMRARHKKHLTNKPHSRQRGSSITSVVEPPTLRMDQPDMHSPGFNSQIYYDSHNQPATPMETTQVSDEMLLMTRTAMS
ncbi:LIM/homeobox protein Awh-like [Artemia franciscana]|uniref:LIM/homeobox protein Awh n=1 Tax=Artemia franciscana TaxID=6661 RepID=A0AA88H3D8_ARTSF|nr:hypothetical protein QYM36_017909 [Artemia franciscana]KAK2703780.1 hypothetical protein QYM36_017909 [Artemia franciscana]